VPDLSAEVARARALVLTAVERGAGWMVPTDAVRVLEAMGIAAVPMRAVESEDEAAAAAATIGYPVALKAFGPGILHKSDAGGVQLHLADEDALRATYRDLQSRLGTRAAGIIVQAMAGEGVEMFIGGLQDAAFGPIVLCGSGGVLVELFADAVCRLCPLTDLDAAEMLNEVRGIARLRGYRGRPVADEAAFQQLLVRVASLLDGCPEIHELDLNPVSVFTTGAAALDVRIRTGPPGTTPQTRRVRY